jgi:hypothetical protein
MTTRNPNAVFYGMVAVLLAVLVVFCFVAATYKMRQPVTFNIRIAGYQYVDGWGSVRGNWLIPTLDYPRGRLTMPSHVLHMKWGDRITNITAYDCVNERTYRLPDMTIAELIAWHEQFNERK